MSKASGGGVSPVAALKRELRTAVKRFAKGFTCEEQGQIAHAFHAGDPLDVLGILPTGMGKSLCYLLPTYLWKRDHGAALTVVVSPLLALMQDQVDAVSALSGDAGAFKLRAEQLNSSIGEEERRAVRRRIREHQVDLLLVGPETLVQPWTYEMLADAARNRVLRGLVVDEAHMIIEWGDQFRPAFKRIAPVRRLLQEAAPADSPLRTLVLTATLPASEREEVSRALGIVGPLHTFEHRGIRNEHYLAVKQFPNHGSKLAQLVTDVRRLRKSGPGIIYCARRAHCEEVAGLLAEKGLRPARYFHGGTAGGARRTLLREFRSSKRMIIVATDAFGLGVDKRDVRWVLHFSMPSSIDQYYQEIGRGGRDRKRCEALLYYCPADRGIEKKHARKVLTTDNFDKRLRAMRKDALVLRKARDRVVRFVEDSALHRDVEDPAATRANPASMRAHRNWNYAVLVRAEENGWLDVGPSVLHSLSCTLAPKAKREQLEERAPLLAKAGLLTRLRVDRPVVLELGKLAARRGLEVRRLQQEVFDLLLAGKVRAAGAWKTRVVVDDRATRHTARLPEDAARRTTKQVKEAGQVDALGEYARSRRCRRWHFYRTYGYSDLYPFGGCGNCDICR